MLDEKMVQEFVEKLRVRAADDPAVGRDVIEVLISSYVEDKDEPAAEIAKTLCELLEPERIGPLLWLTCKLCGTRLDDDDDAKERGTCSACLFGKGE